MGSSPRLVLLTRAGCHLCDVARDDVARVCAQAGVSWREQDVDCDDELAARFGELVPVVLLDGAMVDHWRIEPDRLRSAIANLQPRPWD